MASSSMSIIRLSYGTVNCRTQLSTQGLVWGLFPLGLLQRLSRPCGPAEVLCDNNSVVNNFIITASVFKET